MRLTLGLLLVLFGLPASADQRFEDGRLRLPGVQLVDAASQSVDLAARAAAGPMVLTFGFTTCESICPLSTAVMAEVDALAGPDVTLVTVTLDPARDTPALMARAAAEVGASDRWLWLTGAPDDIARVLTAVRAPPGPLELHDPIFVITDPRAHRYHRSLTLPEPQQVLHLLGEIAR
jgi:protein SCO1